MAKWISFVERPQGAKKTRTWEVISDFGGAELGQVRWFSRWRGYAFFPHSSTVFEKDCLRDLANFVETKTKEHKAK